MLFFIVNERAGSGEGCRLWSEVKHLLREEKIPYKAWVTEQEKQASLFAAQICEQEPEDPRGRCIVVVGGDGTINEVLNGIPDLSTVRLGIIPTGSANDFAKGIGITGTPEENLRRILTALERDTVPVDLGKVSWDGGAKSRLFAISSGVGLDALVCKKALKSRLKDTLNRIHLGKLTYVLLTLQSLFSMQTTDGSILYDGRGPYNRRKTICVSAMNLPAEGGGVPMAPEADVTDGRLSVCSVYGIPKWRTFFLLPPLVMGKHGGFRGIDIRDCGSCTVSLKEPMVLHADGEYCGEIAEMTFTCLPAALNLLK
ncbi:MAG: diacylglycerol/lipid kinase family protein [Roseburia sp.]